MKVLQLIDSLHAGGAERVAVNIANGLCGTTIESYLCATRAEGILKNSIIDGVHYFFLNKKSTLDYKSIRKFAKYIRKEKIEIIHAHSSSFFLATIIKLFNNKVKIVWHDHYGKSAFLNERPYKVLKYCSKYFSYVFCVNTVLVDWVKQNLKFKDVSFLPNFAVKNTTEELTALKGEKGKRILCLANLRPQKDHETLLKAFKVIHNKHIDWTLHCVGKDFEDAYSKKIIKLVQELKLTNAVFFYGSKPDTDYIISQVDIGVLASKSEGLPLALLEYGLASLAVIATDVGDCSKVISDSEKGMLIDKENEGLLIDALEKCITDSNLRKLLGLNLKSHIDDTFSRNTILKSIITNYKSIAYNSKS